MNAKRDLLIVVLLMVALGVAWYYTGGATNEAARSGPFFSFSRDQEYTLPVFTVPSVPRIKSGDSPEDTPSVSTITNYLGTFNEERSPYAEYVSLEESGARFGAPDEYLTIRTAFNMPNRITITGWRIESTATGYGATIPEAAELPFLGSVNVATPVSLAANQVVYLVTARSPNGTSFRTNVCTGYFEQFQDFEPRLRLECPSPTEEADRYFAFGTLNDECYDILETLGRCTFNVQSIPFSAGTQCEQFIHNELSYNGCINRHKNEPKFYKDTWYLYIGRDQELWRSRSERIRLLDENGKVVDVVSY